MFALSGGAAAVKDRLDLFGVLVLAFAAANAGGLTRDLLIRAVPPAAISDWRYLGVSLLAGLVTFFWYPMLDRLRSPVLVFDGAGLAPSSEGAPWPAGSRKPGAPAQTARRATSLRSRRVQDLPPLGAILSRFARRRRLQPR